MQKKILSLIIILFTISAGLEKIVSAQSSSQKNRGTELTYRQLTKLWDSNPLITLELKNVFMADALRQIADRADAGIYFNKKLVPQKRISLDLENVPLSDALRQALKGTNLEAFSSGQDILLRRKREIKPLSKTDEVINVDEIIRGTITDSEIGETLPGVNVMIKGTNIGTSTDSEGSFELEVPSLQDTLLVSFVGYQSREVPINGRTEIGIELTPQAIMGEEMVVVGYGTMEKSNLTGSVASVDTAHLDAVPTTNFSEIIRGKVPGVEVTLGNARPGGSSSILIRGRNSLSAGNSPLIVVDGAPVGNINDVNVADIESVEVLKDASAQAIYGARASNGVIVVTTNRGEPGRTSVSYNGHVGIQTLWKNFEVFDGEEFAEMRREAYRTNSSDGDYEPDEVVFDDVMLRVLENEDYIDWEEFVLRDAFMQQHDISIQGGNERTQVATSIGYFDQDGIIPTSGLKRGTFRINLDHQISDKLSVGTSTFLSRSRERVETGVLTTLAIPPLAEPYDANGNLQLNVTQDEVYTNPLFNLQESDNDQKINRILTNVFADWNITEELQYRLNTNISFRNRGYGQYESTRHRYGQSYGGQAQLYSNETFKYLIENILTYKKDFNAHHQLDVTLMQSISEENYESFSTRTRDLGNDFLGYEGISQGSILSSPSRSGHKRSLLSYMGRVQYNFRDKYLLNTTARIDGSSVFGANEKYGFFPSAALAWRIDQEDFFNFRLVDNFKLRVSYGLTGNEAISPYQTLARTTAYGYHFGNGESVVGHLPGYNDFPNEDLKWETSRNFNIGLDFGLLNDRFSGTLEYYITRTSDLLVHKRVPSVTGFQRVWDNLGLTENKGFEGSLSAHLLSSRNFQWKVDLTFTANRNKILDIFGEVDEEGNPRDDIGNGWFIGEPISNYYDYIEDGVWQLDDEVTGSHQPDVEPGHPKVKDLNGDGMITPEDRDVIYRDPKWYGSISNTLSYKGFDLYADVFIRHGGVRRNSALYSYDSGGGLHGRLNGIKRDYWTPENPSNDTFRPSIGGGIEYKSSLAYQDASYIRFRTLTIGYSFSPQAVTMWGLRGGRIYATATNLFTQTEFQSFSPEANPTSYPEARVFRLGVELNF